jgi:tetratricopeptide (TPR) repeat protein
MKITKGRFLAVISLLLLALFLGHCTSKTEKRDAFLKKGVKLAEAGDHQKAILEFKNAIQLDPNFPLPYLHLAQSYLAQGDLNKARQNFSKALALDAGLEEARFQLASLLIGMGDGEHALETVSPLLEKDSPSNKALLTAGQAYVLIKKPDSAIAVLERIAHDQQGQMDIGTLLTFAKAYQEKGDIENVKKYLFACQTVAPADPTSYLALSMIFTNEQRLPEAESEIRKLIDQNKGETSYALFLCRFLLNTKQYEKAEDEFERLVADYPEENSYRMAYAQYLNTTRKFEHAERLLREAVKNAPQSWPERQALLRTYLFQAKNNDAITELDDFLAASPKDRWPAVVMKGIVLARLDRLDEAEKQADIVLSAEPSDADAHLLKGKILLHKGHFGDAVLHLRQVVDLDESNPDGHLFLARALSLSGDRNVAIATLKKGIETLPENPTLRRELISSFQRDQEWQNALELIEDSLTRTPFDYSFMIEKGRTLVELKKFDKAEEILNAIVEKNPETNLPYTELGKLKAAAGNHAEAIVYFQKALQTKGDKTVPLELLVAAHLNMGQNENAEAVCKRLLENDPQNSFVLNTLGSIYLRQNKYEEAEKSFEMAAKNSPEWERPHQALVTLYEKTNQLHSAADRLQLLLDAGSPTAAFTLGLVYEKLGEFDKAIAIWESLTGTYRNALTVNNNLAYLYAEHRPDKDRLHLAHKHALRAFIQAPDNPQVLDTMAWVEFKSDHLEEAIKYADLALRNGAGDPMINYHAALINAKKGKNSTALRYLQRAIELGLDEHHAEAAQRLIQSLNPS